MYSGNGMNRRTFLVCAAASLAGTFDLGSAFAASPPKRGGILRVSVNSAVAKLNPLMARDPSEQLLSELVYSGLTRFGEDMSPVPDLAESWSSNHDLTVWTFLLRPNLKFHDGAPCTSADVVATFAAIRNPKIGSPARQNVGPISSVRAIDTTTVEFVLDSPYIDFPTAMAFPNAKILQASIVQNHIDTLSRAANGTGPFKLATFHPDRVVTVVKNDLYYDKDRPYLDGVEIRVYPDSTAEGSALISGDTDLMILVRPPEFARLQNSPGIDALRVPSGQFCNVNMGCDQKPFNDVRVRRALALTVDRKVMVDFVAEGYGTPGNDSPITSAFTFYTSQPLKQPNIAEAKRLLAEAGYPNGLSLTLVASDTPPIRTPMAVALREMARPAGFDINVQTMPHATYLEQVWKKGSFYVGYYTMQPTVDAVFSLLYTSDAVWNETRWNNPKFDQIVKVARGTADVAKRQALYTEAQHMLVDEVPSIIPVFFDMLRAKRRHVQGYKIHPRGLVFRLDYVWLNASANERS
ncbi:putative periplasmic solute-binding protein [Burkholderia lata]|uniref:Putative periplasmic solute-binding protein n=1 Tax=Burkholderia lata (strain ATCC 17760 / DSM 23089 / LMG 22485 / NCIMB 9086 / R18194 / 383) TaxID=482957 RepID=A0A6P2UHW6_BURL3|nr:ABC transporter substrate-binding protein [Burkholderia lata]VWC76488.1 putative periplasmic solute-binding protein [Burkholderia lata]